MYDEYDEWEEQDYPETQYETGCQLISVVKENIDYENATELFYKAACQGYDEALNELVLLAMKGIICAQYWLGQYYLNCDDNCEEYARWTYVAVVYGHDQNKKGKFTGNRSNEFDYSLKALESLIESANNYMAEACFYCGNIYERGIVVAKSYETASRYYEIAAQCGLEEAWGRYNKVEELQGHFRMGMITSLTPKRVNEIKDSVKKQESFSMMLLRLIKERNLDYVEFYPELNISRQTWSNTINGKNTPKKEAVLAMAVALKLNLETTNRLMGKLGYMFIDTNTEEGFRDSLVKECIIEGNYDSYFDINEMLYDQGIKISMLLGYQKK